MPYVSHMQTCIYTGWSVMNKWGSPNFVKNFMKMTILRFCAFYKRCIAEKCQYYYAAVPLVLLLPNTTGYLEDALMHCNFGAPAP